jgi:hypothetical protein
MRIFTETIYLPVKEILITMTKALDRDVRAFAALAARTLDGIDPETLRRLGLEGLRDEAARLDAQMSEALDPDFVDLVDASSGVPFRIRIVRHGGAYGLGMTLRHQGPPLIEVYDRRQPVLQDLEGRVLGRFVTRYPLESLAAPDREGRSAFFGHRGLLLDAAIPSLRLSGASMQALGEALRRRGFDAPVTSHLHEDAPSP